MLLKLKHIAAMVLIIMVSTMVLATATTDDSIPTTPKTNNGQKWRIGYYEAGSYSSYTIVFGNIIKALNKMGWLENVEGCPFNTDARTMWQWLASRDTGKYIQFVNDGYYTFNNNEGLRPEIKTKLLQRLSQQKDLDLVLAMGTAAGQDLSNDAHSVPVMVFSTTDAVKAKIVQSNEDSGRDHVWAHCEPDRYKHQIELFHDIFKFKRLGIVYENTPTGRALAIVDDIEAVAQEKGFEVVAEFFNENISDVDAYHQALSQAYSKVADRSDAVYITSRTKLREDRLPEVLAPLIEKKVPTFSWTARYVPNGSLMAVSAANFEIVGGFDGEAIAKVLNGAKPRAVNQAFITPPSITLNLQVADMIGYAPPFTILLTADEVYQDIKRNRL